MAVTPQVFTTIQIPVNQWRWLPVTCVSDAGVAQIDIVSSAAKVSFIRYGEISPTVYNNAAGFENDNSVIVAATTLPIGTTTIKLLDTSKFPPDNGYIHLDPGNANDEKLQYSYNNVSTGELTISPTTKVHAPGEMVGRVDWVQVDKVNAPGSYLLLLPPTILNKVDLFTYIVTNIGGGNAFQPYYNTIDIIGSLDPVSMTTPSLATCKLYGFVVDLTGSPIANTGVSVKLLAVPSTMSNAGLYDNIVSAKTDANGYFEISVLQQATVDIVIADIGYRRTVTVPSTTLAKLFELS
tara:strand:+ start:187 stop:1071 length:885 start_codon:yes stop_codon:yes gene_type:complete